MKSLHRLLLIFILIVMLSGPVLAGPTTSVTDQKKTILVDLTHAERVMVDGAVAPDLDRSQNTRVLNWQDWANDMRSQGYDVRTLIDGPVTAEKLADTCLFIIAEPDMGKNGIAYFTADEAKAIADYVDSGHALLLMGHTFLGGPDKQSYRQDYTSNYVYALIQNDLLKKMKVNMKFTADAASRPIGDIMVDPDSTDMVQGSMSDIWVHEGEKSHEVWKDVPEGRFAYFHGSSIDLPPKGGIAYGDAATFTTRDTTSVLFQDPFAAGLSGESTFMKRVEDVSTSAGVFGLVVKKQGDYPVAIAETRKGCGIIMLYGDSAAWQNSAYWGSVYNNEAFHERKLAYNMVTYLTKHCEDCVTPAPTAAKAKTAPTKVILTPKAGVIVKNNGGDCETCIAGCGTDATCKVGCRDSNNNLCAVDYITPGTSKVTKSGGDCGSCIQTCNDKTVDGVSLTDTELKQCYTTCGSGLCEKTWTSCGGAGGFTVTGPAGIVGTNINPRATETPALGAILSTSANPRATVTPDTGVPSKFTKCTGYEDGQLGYYYCSDCNACISYLAKGYQCSCEKKTEGLNPYTVATADFTPGLRECYMSAMQGSSCSCPATSSDSGAILSTKYQRPTVTVTPTPKGVVSIPDGKVLTVSGGDCGSCITNCNEKTVDGVSLTDTELKQCYATCSSGFCQKTWSSCGGTDTGTEGKGATLSTTANSRDTGNGETDGGDITWTDSTSAGCMGMSDGKKTTWACPNCNSCKDHPNTQCSCPKSTEGSNPQTVTTADFTPGLRECYMSAMQGSSCSCPAPTPTPRPTARVLDIPQMTLVITKTPTATPQSRSTGRVLPIPQQTIIIARTPTPTPTPASLTAKAPAICNECIQTCKGMIGSKYTKCLGDCAEAKGQSRSVCIPQTTLLPSTPQPFDLSSQWTDHRIGSPSNPSTGGTTTDPNPPQCTQYCCQSNPPYCWCCDNAAP